MLQNHNIRINLQGKGGHIYINDLLFKYEVERSADYLNFAKDSNETPNSRSKISRKVQS